MCIAAGARLTKTTRAIVADRCGDLIERTIGIDEMSGNIVSRGSPGAEVVWRRIQYNAPARPDGRDDTVAVPYSNFEKTT